jgi:hypothetical protein
LYVAKPLAALGLFEKICALEPGPSTGCNPSQFYTKNKLMRLKIIPRQVTGIDRKLTAIIDEVIAINLDLDSHREEKVFLYISLIRYYDTILGMP